MCIVAQLEVVFNIALLKKKQFYFTHIDLFTGLLAISTGLPAITALAVEFDITKEKMHR